MKMNRKSNQIIAVQNCAHQKVLWHHRTIYAKSSVDRVNQKTGATNFEINVRIANLDVGYITYRPNLLTIPEF